LKVRITDDGSLILSHLGALERAALEAIPELAASLPQPFWKRPPSIASDNQALLDDWYAYVSPDIESAHRQQSEFVKRTLALLKEQQATNPSSDTPASIRITSKDFDRWYGALNQARLSLESQFQFGQNAHQIGEFIQWSPDKLSRYLQSQFYQAIQIDLLEMMRHTHDKEFEGEFDETE